MVTQSRRKSLFIFQDEHRERLFVSKNSNFQTLVSKDWWPQVRFITVKHFDSLDELEDALAVARSQGTKWNSVGVQATPPSTLPAQSVEHDIFTEGFPVE